MQDITEGLHKDFVYINEIVPSICISARYAGNDNFTGMPVKGYSSKQLALTRPAAIALEKAQEYFQQDGYSLVVYDAYRPQKAINHFVEWSEDIADQKMKQHYFPRVNKEQVFELGYVARKSGHSRGSTVDISIISTKQSLHEIHPIERTLNDGFKILFLDDGTVDMGSSFDLFDTASHYPTSLIANNQLEQRRYLKEIMEKSGFEPYEKEWWHFTLKDEPFKDEYFDFIVP